MRILFTCVAGSQQHLFCLLPLVHAAQAAGDTVVVASGPDRAGAVAALGLPFRAAGLDFPALVRRSRQLDPSFRLGGEDEEAATFAHFFAAVAAPPMADGLLGVIDEFGPDLLVHEPAELGGPLAAAVRGVPVATHDWGLPVPARVARVAAEAVAPAWARHRLDCGPYGGLYEQVAVRICPPSLRAAEEPPPAGHVQALRPSAVQVAGDDGGWSPPTGSGPLVHVTFGTAGFTSVTRLLRLVARALADAGCAVVVAVGTGRGPEVLGEPHPRIETVPFVPHGRLMPHCDAVVTHGGSGTVLAALEHGVPMLVLPLGADQFRMADAVARSGAGVSLRGRVGPADVVRAVGALLARPSFRAAAHRAQAEIAALPEPAVALDGIKAAIS